MGSTLPFRARWFLDGAFTDGMPRTNGPVVIGADVWIGTDVLILSGVEIGHGAIVASGAVVAGDLPPYSIAGGCPARALRYRHTEEQIRALLAIAWWDWPDEEIWAAVPMLSSAPIDDFIERFGHRSARTTPERRRG